MSERRLSNASEGSPLLQGSNTPMMHVGNGGGGDGTRPQDNRHSVNSEGGNYNNIKLYNVDDDSNSGDGYNKHNNNNIYAGDDYRISGLSDLYGESSIADTTVDEDDVVYASEQYTRSKIVRSLNNRTFGNERFDAFSDAVFGIAATIMVIPLTKYFASTIAEEFHTKATMIVAFMLTFSITSKQWKAHTEASVLIPTVDNFLIILNNIHLGVVCFMPYTSYLASVFTTKPIVLIFASTLYLMAIVSIIHYAYSYYHGFIRSEVDKTDLVWLMVPSFILILGASAMVAVAFVQPSAAVLVFALFVLLGFIITLVADKCHIYKGVTKRLKHEISHRFKERVLCYSDGIFAIIATLLVLDLKVLYPDATDHEVNDLIEDSVDEYITWVVSFATVMGFWTRHHFLFSHVETVTSGLLMWNRYLLVNVSLLPYFIALVTPFKSYIPLIVYCFVCGVFSSCMVLWCMHYDLFYKGLTQSTLYWMYAVMFSMPAGFGIGFMVAMLGQSFQIWGVLVGSALPTIVTVSHSLWSLYSPRK